MYSVQLRTAILRMPHMNVMDIVTVDDPESLWPDTNEAINNNLGAECILQASLHTQGAAGFSGLDAYAWRRLYSSFRLASQDLCHTLAAVSRKICSSNIHLEDISVFVACHLIPLNSETNRSR